MTRFEDSGVTDLLYVASDDPPPSRVDLGEVLRDGHRRRFRRRVLAPVVCAAAVVALAAGGLASAEHLWAGPQPRPPATGGPTGTATLNPAPTAFPLDRQLFALDDTLGMPLTGITLSAGSDALQYGDAVGNGILVVLCAQGQDLACRREGYDRVDAPPVDGRPASYLYQQTGEGPRAEAIAFLWAPGAQAVLFHAPGAGTEAQLVQLAQSLRTDVGEPARFGLTVSPPPGLRLVQTSPILVGADGPGLLSGLTFDLGDGPLSEAPTRSGPSIQVRVDYDDVRWVSEGEPMVANTTVGGRPAWVDDQTNGFAHSYTVWLLDPGQPAVMVSVTGDGATDRFGAQQANDLALSVQALGTWDDRTQWTESPIR